MKLKTKAELDKLTEKQIENYRYRILSSDTDYSVGSDSHSYITELEFYTDERFDNTTKQYNKWVEDVEKGTDDELSLTGKKLIVKIGLTGLQWLKKQEKEKYGEPKFIV